MQYELIKFEERCSKKKTVHFEVVRRFKVDEKSYIDDCLNNIAFFQAVAFTWKSVLVSFEEVKASTDKFSSLFVDRTRASIGRAEYTNNVHYIYDKVVNFLSASNLLLNFLEMNATSEEQKKSWNEERRLLHKNNLCYRFCYELRNHSQHASLPLTEISVFNINTKQSPESKVILNRKELIDSNKATKSLIKYLSEYKEDEINLLIVFDDYLKILAKVYSLFISKNESYYSLVVDLYTNYSKFINDENVECIGYVNSRVKDEKLLDEMVRLELGAAQWIIELTEMAKKIERT